MIAEFIDRYVQEKLEKEERDNSKFRVSDAGRCRYMRFLKRLGVEFSDKYENRVLRVFEVGHVFHRWLQDALEEKGLLFAKEYEVQDKHRLGHIDAIVKTEEGLVLYDFKTVHSKKFNYLDKVGVDEHYSMQAVSYYLLLPEEIRKEIVDVRIAYISKDDLRIAEFSVLSPEVIEKTEEDWEVLITAWEKGKEPEKNPKEWECGYCPYKTLCLNKEV